MDEQSKRRTQHFERVLARLSRGHNPKQSLSLREAAQGLTACYVNVLGLLDDARLLAANNRQPRALSLTILALEELAKIPDLYEQYMNATPRNGSGWADFWKRWIQHKPKQKRGTAYGNMLRQSSSQEVTFLHNPTPYTSYLSENAYTQLDTVKQRNFYVDFVDTEFQIPRGSRQNSTALDFLFSFVEDRADSFGSWHISEQRSADFLAVAHDGSVSFNGWASSHTLAEADADLLRLLCYRSSAQVPDYGTFSSECEDLMSKKTAAERVTLFRRAVTTVNHRMKVFQILPTSADRAWRMDKLLFSYATDHFSDTERKEIFSGDFRFGHGVPQIDPNVIPRREPPIEH
jgi:AbiV family abortive infection protein